MSMKADEIRAASAAQHEQAMANIAAAATARATRPRSARLRAAGSSSLERFRAAHAALQPELRDLEEPEDIPTAYRAAIENRAPIQSDLDPTMWPGYDPFGQPANGQAMAIAFRKLQQAEAAPVVVAAASRPEPKIIYRDGVPSGWDTALERNRR